MTRKDAVRIERTLKELGVYKPYVSDEPEMVYHFRCFRKLMGDAIPLGKVRTFDSYPLSARIVPAFNPQHGIVYQVTVTDCTLPRIGQDPVVACATLLTSSLERPIADILTRLHPIAHERARRQEGAILAQRRTVKECACKAS